VLKAESKVPRASGKVVFRIDLQAAIPYIGANNSFDLGFTGKGTYVAVIDTGVEIGHPFLAGKVALEACFSSECPNGETEMYGPGAATPVHWHGTHVAGIIAGENQDFHGIAPDAKIIAINIFDKSGAALDRDIAKALAYIVSLTGDYNIAAVNMSLGGQQPFTETCDTYLPAVTAEIHKLRIKNVATVISSGNNYSLGMSSPACISEAVSVAASHITHNLITDFSNLSEFTTLAAPGYGINSSKMSGAYGTASGTSMAAPFVAGAFAVYRSKYGVQSVEDVVAAFQETAVPATRSYTGITAKQIDLHTLFALPVPPSTTAVVSTSTSSTSTTVLDIDSSTTTVTSVVAAPRVIEISPSSTNILKIEPSSSTSSTSTSTITLSSPPVSIHQLPTMHKKSIREVAALAKINLVGSVKTSIKVLPVSARNCKVVRSTLVELKTGTCKVAVTAVRATGRTFTKSATLFIS
jgi:subtilisin family serine protease